MRSCTICISCPYFLVLSNKCRTSDTNSVWSAIRTGPPREPKPCQIFSLKKIRSHIQIFLQNYSRLLLIFWLKHWKLINGKFRAMFMGVLLSNYYLYFIMFVSVTMRYLTYVYSNQFSAFDRLIEKMIIYFWTADMSHRFHLFLFWCCSKKSPYHNEWINN